MRSFGFLVIEKKALLECTPYFSCVLGCVDWIYLDLDRVQGREFLNHMSDCKFLKNKSA
jgi:hypothetical protein